MTDSKKRNNAQLVRAWIVYKENGNIKGMAQCVNELYGSDTINKMDQFITEMERLPVLCFTGLSKNAEIEMFKAVRKELNHKQD